ncbi:MAG TPA: hemerythrin domain-containing protein [Caulobacteraceae bacterium]|nr:hemerythrin domain-containing protein [Caulobacteraceae bacterium]
MAAVIEALREEHLNISRLLGALEHQVEVFASALAPDYDVVVGVTDYFLDYPDRFHHPKEDAVFARLQATWPEEAAAIGDLLGEHRALHARAQRFHQTVSELLNDTDIPRADIVDAGRNFIEAERRHMRKEEECFLPLAERLLTSADWAEIESKLSIQPDPVFGGRLEEKFKKLSERLLAWEAEDEAEGSTE